MQIVSINKITVQRGTRQRRELTGLPDLADPIRRNAEAMPETGGLIHPIVVTRDFVLVAGERRFTACRDHLGYTTIAVNFADEIDEVNLRLIELEENIKREDITWQEQARAIAEMHSLRLRMDPQWTVADTAKAIGVVDSVVSKNIAVAKELHNDRIAEQPKFSTALGIVQRAHERREASALHDLKVSINAPVERPVIETADFTVWNNPDGRTFNFVHCDFPYGIGADKFDQGSASTHGGYDDTFDNYERLLRRLCSASYIAESAHLVFWFSMEHYEYTLDYLRTEGAWKVLAHPLVWHKTDNAGVLPDPSRQPRRSYETAFFASRGDRKIVGAVGNIYGAPTVRDKHMSEKPEPMLRHFFKMFVDENTVMLDPTAGSGSALRAARSYLPRHMTGLEINPEYARLANLAFKGAI